MKYKLEIMLKDGSYLKCSTNDESRDAIEAAVMETVLNAGMSTHDITQIDLFEENE